LQCPHPRSIEFNEDILLVIKNNLVVVVGNNDGDWAVLVLWGWLRLDAWLEGSRCELLNKFADLLGCDLLGLVEWVFLVLAGVLNGKCGPLANLEVQVCGVLTERLGVNGSEVDLSTVLLSNGLDFLGEFLALILSLSEEIGKWDTRLINHVSKYYGNHL